MSSAIGLQEGGGKESGKIVVDSGAIVRALHYNEASMARD